MPYLCFLYQGPLISGASSSHHRWVLGRARICHMAWPEREAGPGGCSWHAAPGERCSARELQLSRCHFMSTFLSICHLASYSEWHSSPSATAVSAGVCSAQHSSSWKDQDLLLKTLPIATAMEHTPYTLIRKGRDGRWRGSELPNVTQVTEEGMVLLWVL